MECVGWDFNVRTASHSLVPNNGDKVQRCQKIEKGRKWDRPPCDLWLVFVAALLCFPCVWPVVYPCLTPCLTACLTPCLTHPADPVCWANSLPLRSLHHNKCWVQSLLCYIKWKVTKYIYSSTVLKYTFEVLAPHLSLSNVCYLIVLTLLFTD